MTEPAGLQYQLDRHDHIVAVSPEWDEFARANDGDAVLETSVLGRPIWTFISDPTTREIYRDLLRRARGGHEIRFRFRCDSPDVRRLLEMTATPQEHGAIAMATTLISKEQRDHQELLNVRRGASAQIVIVCSWCKKFLANNRWVEVEEAVVELGLFEQTVLPALSHGICGDCSARVLKESSREKS